MITPTLNKNHFPLHTWLLIDRSNLEDTQRRRRRRRGLSQLKLLREQDVCAREHISL
jgi:hypothetical protein